MDKVHFLSKRKDWETPWDLFNVWDSKYKFTLDVCASKENTKCKRFFSDEDDGLSKSWAGETCWMNPPYSSESILPLCFLQCAHRLITMLSKRIRQSRNNISFANTPSERIVKICDSQDAFISFCNKKRKCCLKDNNGFLPINGPYPTDLFVILSRIFSVNLSHSKNALDEFYRRFMSHLNFQVESVNWTSLKGFTGRTDFSLMDAYTTFAIDNPGKPNYEIFIRDFIVPLVKGFIKWCDSKKIHGIYQWTRKAATEGVLVAALLPARTDTKWFHDFVYRKEDTYICFIKSRIKFVGAKYPAPFPSMIVIFHGDKK